jgi:NAD(P)H dehydrogenase (quinone)
VKVLIVYTHPNPRSFCHAVLERFEQGLLEAGHVAEVVDLYAIGFNPVFGMRDFSYFADDSVPLDVLESMDLKQRVIALSGGPVRRLLAKRWLRGRSIRDVVKLIARNKPSDVLEQQKKVAAADGLVFIAPVFWMGFPAILKGWIERVFNYGFAYSLTEEGWRGNLQGRVPLLKHKKALVISTTFFSETDYGQGYADAMHKLIDEWSFEYPGAERVEHVYFYATRAVDDEVRKEYLHNTFLLGKNFSEP